MKTIINIAGFFIIVGGTFAFAYYCGKQARHYPDPFKIKNIGEIQQQLIDAGFKDVVVNGEPNEVTVDYIWGSITEQAYCNYMAVKSMERMAGEKE